ncbi:ATP-binding protein [[Kitasatospora] papulosa]|uniref:histidine kinase n=1 Tax=[Kitasatospora] papulosa TaxID=1464011 RepID=A0ABZ1KAM6_9ACTN|nr:MULTISPECIES: ATP-binding protein [Streptomyces]MDX3180376.1 ATP-binding protein [Streptomyces sp. ME02-7008A-1]MDX3301117.1 ATP-binding protein [Streptomyces sp. ME02-7008A]QBR09694.1 ATP-binding protein [Streptomyces sp. S501]WJY34830.1 ATP-binding protein [Streptomyces sp. P9-2B-1]WSK26945.1 ATP-binding protein [[Kitasatospora] papulosa]
MSQLRAPDARPERREGGRHGRPGGRSHSATSRPRAAQPAPDGRLRPQLMRTALLPTVAALLSGAAAVIFTIRASGVRPSGSLLAALGGSGALAVAAVAAAFLGAGRVSAAVLDRALTLRRTGAQHHDELQRLVERIRDGEPLPARRATPPAAADADAFDLLAQEMNRAQDSAVAAVVEASQLFRSNGNEQKVEVFVNLARRLQSLVHREIQILDELENQVEDPDLLKGLFHVDHLATRIRRHAENLAVLGGAVSRRQWSSPVTMTEVLRSAIAEVEQYPRVKLVPPIDGTLRGHAVADVIHLLAELVENATVFSAPHTQVLLRAQRVTAGLALEVEDRGLGMPGPEQKRMNTLLADPDQVNVAHLLQDGRIGLFVVASLARRHGIAVRLQSNIYGGTQAVLVLPEVLLGIDIESTTAPDAAPAPSPGTVHLPPARGAATPAPAQVTAEPSPERAPGGNGQGGGPPLPLRAERVDRPNPAASPPVARTVQPDPAPVPVPFGGPVSPAGPVPPAGPVESAPPRTDAPAPAAETRPARPQLPRRSNQEHLVPQLREAPVRRTEDENVLHDPGLMAAFRRGVDLAEAQTAEERETAHPYGAPGAVPATGPVPSVGAQRSHGLAPLPLRAPTTTATTGPGPVHRTPQTPEPDPRTGNTFKE